MQATTTNIGRTSPPHMVHLTKPVPRRLLPIRIGKDARRCNNAIRGRHAPTKGARNPGCGPVDKRRPLRTSSLLLTLMATSAAAYAGSTIGGTIVLCTLAGAALGPRLLRWKECASRQREHVTGRRSAPNSSSEAQSRASDDDGAGPC